MTTEANARPAANGTGVEQVGETSGDATGMPLAWHEQAEHEGQWWYAAGYADGWAAAEQALAAEIVAATGGIEPYDRSAVIRGLVASIGEVKA